MRLSKVWIVARKDLTVFQLRRSVLYSVIIFPVLVGVGLALALVYIAHRGGGITNASLVTYLDGFAFFFIIAVVTLPTAIASYSLVGEKIERSLEPLLATPTTDGEILLGKSIAAFLPPLGSTFLGAFIYVVLADAITVGQLGYYYFPNPTFWLIFLVIAPLSCALSVEISVIISGRVSDVRAAQEFAGLLVLPFVALYLAGEIGVFSLDEMSLTAVAITLLIVDLSLFFVSRATFQRDEILTQWQ